MSVAFNGVERTVLTFHAESGTTAGGLAAISGNNTVHSANSGEAAVGLVLGVRDGYAAVQVKGYVEVGYAGTLSLGWLDLTSDNGKLRTGASNEKKRRCLVVNLDTTNKIAGLFLC